MAFVLVSHMDPTHESLLGPILSQTTPIPVHEAKDGARVEPDNAYVIPPKSRMAISKGVLKLGPRVGIKRECIDFFFTFRLRDSPNIHIYSHPFGDGSSMRMTTLALLGVLMLGGCGGGEGTVANGGGLRKIVAPPAGYYYHGVYPGDASGNHTTDVTPANLSAYQTAAGRPVAWVYYPNEWYVSRAFPLATADWIRASGAVPYIRLMIRSSDAEGVGEPTFTPAAIVSGAFDADLRAWGDAARAYADPLLVEYGVEMNGKWMAWNGTWSGGAAGGTTAFKAAYRHIVETIRGQGATNIVWVFHVNDRDVPNEGWNAFENYYPGDDVVDWIGTSCYGVLTPLEPEWISFRTSMDAVMPRLVSLAKGRPIIIPEFGVTAGNPLGSATAWADEMLADILGNRWPQLCGFSWLNEGWPNDANPAHNTEMRVQAIAGMSAVFQARLVGNPAVVDRPIVP